MQITAIKFTGHDEEGFFFGGAGGFFGLDKGFQKEKWRTTRMVGKISNKNISIIPRQTTRQLINQIFISL